VSDKYFLHPTTSLPSIFINLLITFSNVAQASVVSSHGHGEVDQDDYPYHTTATLLTRPLKDIMDMVEREHIPSYNFRPKEEDIILVRAGPRGKPTSAGPRW
jgi:hypothetical protein